MMLTNDLLDVKISGRLLEPRLLSLKSPTALDRAETLLELLQMHQGKTLGQLQESIQEVAALEVNHKLWKGLAKVLMDNCEFVPPVLKNNPDVSAAEVREQVFFHAAKMGFASQTLLDRVEHSSVVSESPPPEGFGRQTKEAIVSNIAQKLGEDTTDLLQFLYADHKDMHLLQTLPEMNTPVDLLNRYNLVLCQSLLLYAQTLHVKIDNPSPQWVEYLFRKIKFYRLLFRVWKRDTGIELLIDGPQSLLSQSSRYGLQFAMFLPALALLPTAWRLDATLLWGKSRKTSKMMTLGSETKLQSHYQAQGLWKSNTEEWFEQRFHEKEREWTLEGGELLDLGEQQILIPNYTLRHRQQSERHVFLNIIGFWRKKQVLHLIDSSPENVIFAISKKYAGATEDLPKRVQNRIILFAEVIPVTDVLGLAELL